MENRFVTMEEIDLAIAEKTDFYQDLLLKKILTYEEFEQAISTMNSVRTLLLFKSHAPKEAA